MFCAKCGNDILFSAFLDAVFGLFRRKLLSQRLKFFNISFSALRQPFSIRFLSDGFEGKDEIDEGAMVGFKLTYIQSAKGCIP